jgi:hypothetical protein
MYTPETFFEEEINFKILLLKAMLSYSCSKFRKLFTAPAARIRVLRISEQPSLLQTTCLQCSQCDSCDAD